MLTIISCFERCNVINITYMLNPCAKIIVDDDEGLPLSDKVLQLENLAYTFIAYSNSRPPVTIDRLSNDRLSPISVKGFRPTFRLHTRCASYIKYKTTLTARDFIIGHTNNLEFLGKNFGEQDCHSQ